MYIAEVLAAVQTILEKMPDLKSSDPLLETDGGSIAPYDPAKYSQKWTEAGEAGQMHYLCGINFFFGRTALSVPFQAFPCTSSGSRNSWTRSHQAS